MKRAIITFIVTIIIGCTWLYVEPAEPTLAIIFSIATAGFFIVYTIEKNKRNDY